ncbi:secreted RxLR effector protein 161-like [Daphnia magna]|uniref:secreted RxLR effector protein 161-like n=1 Tax=Daphnia magna TaxID=35525 RepID=UPI001E1BA623|nr:secreted RxLR effector protein 161-like [Daphnia magna]
MKEVPYQSAVGALLYFSTTTRTDIAYAVSKVARFNQNPGVQHWIAVKRIIRYLAETRDYGLIFSPIKEEGVHGFTDADYGGDPDDRKSTSGCIFLLQGGYISWFSRKQECTATSTTEAEFVAGSKAAKEGTWMKSLLEEIGQRKSGSIPLFCDNQGTIQIGLQPENAPEDETYRHLILLHQRSPDQWSDKQQIRELPGTTSKYLHEASGCSKIQVSS